MNGMARGDGKPDGVTGKKTITVTHSNIVLILWEVDEP